MSVVRMMIGMPGSGKSTFLKRFSNHIVLSSDNYIEEKSKEMGITYNEGFPLFINGATSNLIDNLKMAIHNNSDVVWDQTNLSRKVRISRLNNFPHDYTRIGYVFDPEPPSVLFERMKLIRPDKIIDLSILENMAKTFQSPTIDEGFDELYFVKYNNGNFDIELIGEFA